MSRPRYLAALARAFLIEGRRSKAALFWNLAFPLVVLIGLLLVFGGGDAERERYVLPGVLVLNLIAAAFFGISLHMVSLRERGLYRRLRVTPIDALSVVLAHAVTSLVLLGMSMALQLAVALAVFDVEVAGSTGQVALALLVSAFAFIPLGLMVGCVAGDMKTAPALSNLLFFPMAFLSGAAMPLSLLPGWIQRLAELLPATYAGELLRAAIMRGDFEPWSLAAAVLVLTGLLAIAFDVLLFRWESREPLRQRALALALGALAAVYLPLFLADVELRSREPFEPRPLGDGAASVRIFHGMTILDGSGNRLEDGWVRIEGDRIAAVGLGAVPAASTAVMIDLSGTYMIPGLVDSHVHMGGSAGGSASPGEFLPARLLRDLQIYLALGITSVVSMTDDLDDLETLRAAVTAGTMRAPRPYYTGPGLTAPGGHPAKFFVFLPGLADAMTRQVDTPAEAAAAVRELAARKVALLKLFLEAGWVDQFFPVLPEPAFRAAVEAASELGLEAAVHVDHDRHARLAIAAGARSVEHVPPDLGPETIAAMSERGVWLVPTLVSFEGLAKVVRGEELDDPLVRRWVDPNVLDSLTSPDSWIARVRRSRAAVDAYGERYERARQAVRAAIDGGVRIVAGSDAGNPAAFHGPGLLRELELLVEAGMTPAAAVHAATGAAAERLGTADVGRIAPGALADLVVLSADPSRDIRALRDVRAVYLGGRLLDRDTLLTTSPGTWMPGRPEGR